MANNAPNREVNLAAPFPRTAVASYSTKDGPNDVATQQMHALEPPPGWDGGNYLHAGPHDHVCFVCGKTEELVGCQTCKNCYHAACTSPPLDPENIPLFWFCPRCVERDLHIPSSLADEHFFAPLPTSLPIYTQPKSPAIMQTRPSNSINSSEPGIQATNKRQETQGNAPKVADRHSVSVAEQPTTKSPELQTPANSRPGHRESSGTNLSSRSKRGRERHSSPPRKKSKYSAFSSDVDKALAVLYSELETAAQYGKSEGNLQGKVQALEQKLKVQEGQMLLTNGELESTRKDLAMERSESALLKAKNLEIMVEMARLKETIQKKENELEDWRTKLRSMIGSEFG